MSNSKKRIRLLVATIVVCCVTISFASSQETARESAPQREGTTNSIGMKLVQLPAGEFDMGASDSDELASKDEGPRHRVRIRRPFMMGIHEVTVGQFRAFVDATNYVTAAERGKSSGFISETRTFQYDQQGFNWKNLGWKQTDDHPVLNVNWFDAVAFCEWLSKTEGRKYRLPTEAEWEYACRAGTESRFITGESIDQLQAIANLQDESLYALRPRFSTSETTSFFSKPVSWDDTYPFSAPVGSFRPNAFGLYDMLGNAAEWCSDWYSEDYYHKSAAADPMGPFDGKGRIVRGGAFLHRPMCCRVTWRIGGTPTYHNYIIGFRVVADIALESRKEP
jgi:formylglycine-generating enzyme required for sulfatase activity